MDVLLRPLERRRAIDFSKRTKIAACRQIVAARPAAIAPNRAALPFGTALA
jgi:hypothetical protein